MRLALRRPLGGFGRPPVVPPLGGGGPASPVWFRVCLAWQLQLFVRCAVIGVVAVAWILHSISSLFVVADRGAAAV